MLIPVDTQGRPIRNLSALAEWFRSVPISPATLASYEYDRREYERVLEFFDAFRLETTIRTVVDLLLVTLGIKRGEQLKGSRVHVRFHEQQKRTIEVKALHRPLSIIPKSLRPTKVGSWR